MVLDLNALKQSIPNLTLPDVPGTINGVPISFRLDTGTSWTAVNKADAQKARLTTAKVLEYRTINTANGQVKEPLVEATMTLKGSAPFQTAVTISDMGDVVGSVVSVSDLVKVFNINVTTRGFAFTPVSRPAAKAVATIKGARAGWASSYMIISSDWL